MTDYLVLCSDVAIYRQSVAIWIGNFRTKYQRLAGTWDPALMVGGAVPVQDLSSGEDYSAYSFQHQGTDGFGSNGIWVWDDGPHDRLTIWRPSYTSTIAKVALLVTTPIDADTSNYYKFKLLNSSDDAIMAYLYTNATALSGETPNEMTVNEADAGVTSSQAVILQIEDELAKAPITGLTVVIDYDPGGS